MTEVRSRNATTAAQVTRSNVQRPDAQETTAASSSAFILVETGKFTNNVVQVDMKSISEHKALLCFYERKL